jgi:hypothetical protein
MSASPPPPSSLTAKTAARLSPFGAFIDRLLQTFEDCRPGLSDGAVAQGERAVEAYFVEVYDRERPRLLEQVRENSAHLSLPAVEALYRELDRLIRAVVIPAYVRLAARMTPRERNDFYLAKEPFHGLERVAWGIAGMALGLLAIGAPFIPLWSKEWVVPFMAVGLVFPNLRSYLALRRFERELNELAARADRETSRIDVAYLMRPEPASEPPLPAAEESPLPAPHRRRTH